jgi:peptidoglycan/LPS O-acetylase OafA/YrhL
LKSLSEKSFHYDFIDGLRGIAILMVLLNHWYFYFIHANGENWITASSHRWLTAGNTGVLLFFLVSAFTLFSSGRRKLSTESYPAFSFFIRRFFRVWPLWWLAQFVYSALNNGHITDHLSCFFLVCSFFPNPFSHAFPGDWSLVAEESFYLFVPLLARSITSTKNALYLLLFCFGLRISWIMAHQSMPNIFLVGANPLFPLYHWYCFATGILLYFVWSNASFSEHLKKSRIVRSCLTVFTIILVYQFLGRASYGKGDVLSSLSLSFFFLASAFNTPLIGWLTRLKAMKYFGVCCYSLYLWHWAVILSLQATGHELMQQSGLYKLPVEVQMIITFPIFVGLMALIGWMSFTFLERPLVTLGRRLCSLLNSTPREARLPIEASPLAQ